MRSNLVRCAVLIVIGCLCAALALFERTAFTQSNDPLTNNLPVSIIRKTKSNRRTTNKARPVERVPLLKLEWRLYKVLDDGSQKETSMKETVKSGDRLRLSVRTNQKGYLYVIHQTSPTSPGVVLFPDWNLNEGRSAVNGSEEIVLPSNCPVKIPRRDCALIIEPSGEQELFHVFFTRDQLKELPNSAADATGAISPELLDKLKVDSGQPLKRQKGSTPLSEILANINTRDNEEIIETLALNKR
jgi:hypothetical protein